MGTIATCAVCGDKKELCGSVRIDGIQQPRFCKDCLLLYMQTGDMNVNDIYWLVQLAQLSDQDSMLAIKGENNDTKEIPTGGI